MSSQRSPTRPRQCQGSSQAPGGQSRLATAAHRVRGRERPPLSSFLRAKNSPSHGASLPRDGLLSRLADWLSRCLPLSPVPAGLEGSCLNGQVRVPSSCSNPLTRPTADVEVGTRMLANSGIARPPKLELFLATGESLRLHSTLVWQWASGRVVCWGRAAWPSDATQIFISRSRPRKNDPSQPGG